LIEEPIATPITKGDEIGQLVVTFGDNKKLFPLYAGEDVEEKSFFSRIFSAIYYIVLGTN